MAITTRQTNLLVNQDWTKVYQTFKEADFQSYDFETLRKTMIDYLRTYYPEDFNDYTESSEYIALIDLIAFLGQSLAFRGDLNARENFIDTASRRDSILKLARLVAYNPKRSTPATGILKIDSVSTTESITDSNGLDISNTTATWNDTTNPNWQEQMTAILNAALMSTQSIGNPGNSQTINGILIDEYGVNLVPGVNPQYSFNASVDGNYTAFEAVSATTVGQSYIYEDSPIPQGRFNILYQNDNLGNGSNNTGFFVYFKQGQMTTVDFSVPQGLPNRSVSINYNNINNIDAWLYALDSSGNPNTLWEQVPAIAGINVVYNTSNQRNLYQLNTRTNDQVDIVFGDGSFSNIPQGNFRFYFRVGNGLRYKITPDEMQGVAIQLVYVSKNNRVETLTLTASLQYTVVNADVHETSEEVRSKAPQQYYTQNRMITGEDYNIFPYTNFGSILKVKAVNRTSSGISRYLDVLDATGKYSSTNVFASDGMLYKEESLNSVNFSFSNVTDINNIIYNTVYPIVSSTSLVHYYYEYFTRYTVTNAQWVKTSYDTNTSTGYLIDSSTLQPQTLGIGASGNYQYINTGALIRFNAGAGNYFNSQNQIVAGTPVYDGDQLYIYAAVFQASNSTQLSLTQNLPTGAIVDMIIPVFKNILPTGSFNTQMVQLFQSLKNFGLRYDVSTTSWKIILPQDLGNGAFSLSNQGDQTGAALDNSWLINFVFVGSEYMMSYRGVNYIFESMAETRFYFDPKTKVYDSKTGLTLTDQVKILKINSAPDSTSPLGQDQIWYVSDNVVEADGYINNTRVLVTFPDSNNDGIPDNPDLFTNYIQPNVNPNKKFVFFQQATGSNNFITIAPIDNSTIVTDFGTQSEILANATLYSNGQVFYAVNEGVFYLVTIE